MAAIVIKSDASQVTVSLSRFALSVTAKDQLLTIIGNLDDEVGAADVSRLRVSLRILAAAQCKLSEMEKVYRGT